MAGTPAQKGYNEAGNNDYSRKVVELASVGDTESERRGWRTNDKDSGGGQQPPSN